ncbi:MAG TPA: SRPBCC family protein [Myxococcota bacterium]|nr:SRPBCC family protein [Myxococcota bacterium]
MWTLALLALSATPSAPSDYRPTRVEDGCQFSVGPAAADGVVPVQADCHWPDVSPEKVGATLSDWAAHARYFSSVDAVKVLEGGGARVVMHQVHVASGISNREATLIGTREARGAVTRYGWTMRGATQVAPASGNVQCGRDDGYWDVSAHPEGGSRVTYHLEYDPAGSVPGFLVRAFQTGGVVTLVTELHQWAKK